MNRIFAKISRFFWSWGFLEFLLLTIILIVFFYVEEDWRGARAWAATQAEWEAKGETFDYSKFTPPPIADDQNLGAIPLFKLERVKNEDGSSYLVPVSLKHAMRDDLPSLQAPSLGNWMRGESPDMAKIRNAIAANYSMAVKDTKLPDNSLAQFNAIYPFLADFRATASTHHLCRFNVDYAISPPAARSYGILTYQLQLSKVLTLHAILALDNHQSDLALEDIKLNYQLLSGVKRDPTLIGGLVALGMNAIGNAAICDGLAQHEWNDAQLAEFEQNLKPINFLADYQFAMRCEAAQSTANFNFFQHVHRSDLDKLFGWEVSDIPLTRMFDVPWPAGWWDQNKSRMATYLFSSLANVDPKLRRVFPEKDSNLQSLVDQANARWDAWAPWKILANIAAGPVVKGTQHFAQAQCWIDEARIACALERYRLARGVYPDSLSALAPTYLNAAPHDIMNGEPYHYQLRPDGTFLLYSVGWNEKDDGGKVVYKTDNPNAIDYEQGDWVWPTPK